MSLKSPIAQACERATHYTAQIANKEPLVSLSRFIPLVLLAALIGAFMATSHWQPWGTTTALPRKPICPISCQRKPA